MQNFFTYIKYENLQIQDTWLGSYLSGSTVMLPCSEYTFIDTIKANIHVDHLIAATFSAVCFKGFPCYHLHQNDLPSELSPSCLQTTAASELPQKSSHTVPQIPPKQISTLPDVSFTDTVPASLTSVSLHSAVKLVPE